MIGIAISNSVGRTPFRFTLPTVPPTNPAILVMLLFA